MKERKTERAHHLPLMNAVWISVHTHVVLFLLAPAKKEWDEEVVVVEEEEEEEENDVVILERLCARCEGRRKKLMAIGLDKTMMATARNTPHQRPTAAATCSACP